MNGSLDIERLRAEYAEALEGETPDFNRLIELAAETAQKDPDHVRFSTDAGIISRLGRELVAKEETAVAELIKNAYDADATFVQLTFQDSREEGGVLIIDDNGLGMTRDQLIAGFMRLSSNDKVVHPYSTRYNRKRAGRKGIGRFAVQRLGKVLTIITQTKNSSNALKIEIDWEAFTQGRELTTIASTIETLEKKQKEEGTTLIISDLREGWSEKAILRVYRYVSELQQPYPLHTGTELNKNEEQASNDIKADPGFKTELIEKLGNSARTIANEETEIFSHALARIDAYVDANGNGFWSMKSDRLEIDIEDTPIGPNVEEDEQSEEDDLNEDEKSEGGYNEYDSDDFEEDYDKSLRMLEQRLEYEKRMKIADIQPFKHLKNVSINAYYFIWNSGLISRSMSATLRNLATEKGGIRIYRNGFRVLPYGEKNDDWLELDDSYARRIFLPPHGNSNFFGFVELIDRQGFLFDETSSREGLLENAAFEELRKLTYRVLIAAVLQVAQARGRKQSREQINWNKEKNNLSDFNAIKGAADRLITLVKIKNSNHTNGEDDFDYSDIADEIKNAVDNQEILRNELIAELGLLRVLASLGLVIGEFTHEVRQLLSAAYVNARALSKVVFSDQKDKETAEDLFSNIQSFRTYANYFDRAVSDNALRELSSQDLRLVIRNFVATIESSAQRRGIVIETVIDGYDILTPPMHSSELSSLLFNLYTNSQKAIRRARKRGKIRIKSGIDDRSVYLEFSDNGDGIPVEHQERIFDAFFTTSTPVDQDASQEDELQGTGLGLKIVKDIVAGYDGEIYLTNPPEGYNTSFRVELPLYIEK
ncbi:sensor histidine kinase [Hymenobacter psychrotolerans]|uniref:histidine kinase n=1 Tax=Hymenobacter psychrotolerans DSM 18569 TaxID=1121959 RepID=A0A1M7E4V1_9BACT|nr:sensor histidine kinase [Hymenobacter psychrotolerans]SHL86772.1 Histidine kinase-, DNA gyrase B-, and HSP90-like ATPase [Hymenobacter psychrotolerans DSM 18569]